MNNHNYFLIIPSYIWRNPNLNTTQILLYGHLFSNIDTEGACILNYETLALMTNESVKRVEFSLKGLENEGLITIKPNKILILTTPGHEIFDLSK